MRIGIIGVGHIGSTLARELSRRGHDVAVANSRGPETIEKHVLAHGARAVTAHDAVEGAEVLILSVPLSVIPGLAPLIAGVPESTTIIDTSNYYPMRDGDDLLPSGQAESEWVVEQLGRPVAKAWNTIGSQSLERKGAAAGAPGRIALPVAADRPQDRDRAVGLVDETGFDPYDAGELAQSWRQQPGNPCYGTDLTLEELPAALAAADAERAPRRRDLTVAIFAERMGSGVNPDADWGVAVSRLVYG